ncbi:hypothetical protein HUJ05_005034 [Dendroctonus ponderosae]|nr:hypothetical protein HUJ05_005034 [Dendroctonus ponderosae]
MISKRCVPYRPHDYMYDPIFTVSGPVDHYKAAIIAKMSSIKFQLCPIFPNMFSDLPNHPRIQLVQRRQRPILPYEERLQGSNRTDPAMSKSIDVAGADRAKFFCPIINLPPKDFVGVCDHLPRFTIERAQKVYEEGDKLTGSEAGKKSVHVQTVYRDSTAQTIPWEPPYKIIGEGEPEILKLEFLKWASGLPAGVHEVRLIERARMKRAWENAVKPDINDENSLQKFRDYVEALEQDEWAFREQEIQEIQELRLQLLEKMLQEIHERSHDRAQDKLERFIKAKEQEKLAKLDKIRKQTARELRKLELEEKGVKRKYHQPDIIEEHISKASELYGPLMRNGEHPKRWHQIIDEKMKRYQAQFIGVEQFSTLPRWLNQATNLKGMERKDPNQGPQLCIRETKWTAPVLKSLHEELQNLRKASEKKACSLRIRNQKVAQDVFTPEVEGIPPDKELQYQAIVYLQSIIEGRATQMMIYEGRENCKELIQELKYSVGLLKKQKELRSKEKLKVRMQQREETIQSVMVSRLQGTLGKLQGQVVGSILDFLNKELRRLLEERKAHAMCWVNERERNIREAAEAGRRQKEIRRRKEHDEIFKQIVKVTQESVDVYLQDIITEGMDFAGKDEALRYVLALANKVEKEVNQIDKSYAMEGVDTEDELIADLVHHFVLPEVEKQTVRESIVKQQQHKLKTVHETIYQRLEKMPKVDQKTSFNENSLYSSSPTIEHYQYKIEEMLESAANDLKPHASGSVIPLAGTIQGHQSHLASEDSSHPEILELYLNMLASHEELQRENDDQQPFDIQERIPEVNRSRRYQSFGKELDTIIEIDNEESASATTDATIKDTSSFTDE